MTDQLLIAEGVRKVYRTGAETVEALRGVDLVVHEGEFVSVMGPSGSGKTTLLNCCSGLDDIDGGRVLLDGVDLHALSDAERTSSRASSMGFIFQAYNLIPVFSAVENVELPSLLAGADAKDARRRAHETLAPGTGPVSCRVGSNSASRLHVRSRAGPEWCGPTSPRARSIRIPQSV